MRRRPRRRPRPRSRAPSIPLPMGGGTVDYTQVNVVFTPNGGSQITIPNVANKMACPASGDGWYYDNPNAPTNIILCESTCGSVQTSGIVQITLGCNTVILKLGPVGARAPHQEGSQDRSCNRDNEKEDIEHAAPAR